MTAQASVRGVSIADAWPENACDGAIIVTARAGFRWLGPGDGR